MNIMRIRAVFLLVWLPMVVMGVEQECHLDESGTVVICAPPEAWASGNVVVSQIKNSAGSVAKTSDDSAKAADLPQPKKSDAPISHRITTQLNREKSALGVVTDEDTLAMQAPQRDAQQQWQLEDAGDGYRYFKTSFTGKERCLSAVHHGFTTSRVKMATCGATPQDHQLWKVVRKKNDFSYIYNKKLGDAKALTFVSDDRIRVMSTQGDDTQSNAQLWKITQLEDDAVQFDLVEQTPKTTLPASEPVSEQTEPAEPDDVEVAVHDDIAEPIPAPELAPEQEYVATVQQTVMQEYNEEMEDLELALQNEDEEYDDDQLWESEDADDDMWEDEPWEEELFEGIDYQDPSWWKQVQGRSNV